MTHHRGESPKQHPTGSPSAPEPGPAREVRTVWTAPQHAPTTKTWRCTGCATYVPNAVAVCDTCGYDKWGNTYYSYVNDPRPEHAVVLTWPDGETADDAIKADSPAQALTAARANWPGARVQLASSPRERDVRTYNLPCLDERAAQAVAALFPSPDAEHQAQAHGTQVKVTYERDAWLWRVGARARHHRLISAEAFAAVEEVAEW
ncbi:hypothetical protein [Nocardiopsis deserti]|uniref:hypothetical protein n=1 Tax=Nocardiopsis deserti TaxID=2605988 RepID=UPI00123BD6D6|nr:hypothetical protein [Nocardiopsis deserti]